MFILGLSAYFRDSAACLLKDDQILACAMEEWFSRIPHDSSFPHQAIGYCLRANNLRLSDIGLVVYYEKPVLKVRRILETCYSSAPFGFKAYAQTLPKVMRHKLWRQNFVSHELDYSGQIILAGHHHSLAGSAFFPSPFDEAAILVADSLGEWATNSIAVGKANRLAVFKELVFPHSLGLLYSAVATTLGFIGLPGEREMSTLSHLGEPRFVNALRASVIDIKPDGSYHLNQKCFDFLKGGRSISPKFWEALGLPVRNENEGLSQADLDVAASVEQIVEETLSLQVRHLRESVNVENLCITGSFSNNPRVIGRIQREGVFKNVWVQPAADIAGAALGAAFAGYYSFFGKERRKPDPSVHRSWLLGPSYPDSAIEKTLLRSSASYQKVEEQKLYDYAAEFVRSGKIVAWYNDRAEFGDQSQGSRSIIADPRAPEVMEKLLKLNQGRSSLAHFSAMILQEDIHKYCDYPGGHCSTEINWPLRSDVFLKDCDPGTTYSGEPVTRRSSIPLVTQPDDTVNFKILSESENPKFYKLLRVFKRKTGCSMLVNISFNIPGMPIVCSPADAYDAFMQMPIDVLIMGHFLLLRSLQPEILSADPEVQFGGKRR
jgi:carbamoyltransferase